MSAPTAATAFPSSIVERYLQTLDAAWQSHLAPRQPGAPTVISLFAGAGGSSLGYSMAGYRELLAVEWDDDAAATFHQNFPEVKLYHGDITKLDSKEAMWLAGNLQPGELDVLDGSPPCQGFSTAGRRIFDDDRNQLFREYARLLRDLRPKVLIMENVSGMVKGKMKLLFAEIMRELQASGYRVCARLMNAACFGVPQDRDRLIFVGVREDIRKQLPTLDISEFSPSRPQTAPISFAEACWDLRGNCEDDRMLPQVLKDVARYQPHSWSTHRDVYRHFKGNTASSMSLQWASWDRTCGTILKSEIHLAGIVHPDRERYISLREAKRIASFPDDFQFTNRKKGIERIGNSVPPLFMKAIAAHVRERVLVPASSTSSVCA